MRRRSLVIAAEHHVERESLGEYARQLREGGRRLRICVRCYGEQGRSVARRQRLLDSGQRRFQPRLRLHRPLRTPHRVPRETRQRGPQANRGSGERKVVATGVPCACRMGVAEDVEAGSSDS